MEAHNRGCGPNSSTRRADFGACQTGPHQPDVFRPPRMYAAVANVASALAFVLAAARGRRAAANAPIMPVPIVSASFRAPAAAASRVQNAFRDVAPSGRPYMRAVRSRPADSVPQRASRRAGAVWVIGVSAPAVVTGIVDYRLLKLAHVQWLQMAPEVLEL